MLVARDVTDRVHHDEREIHQERLAVLDNAAVQEGPLLHDASDP